MKNGSVVLTATPPLLLDTVNYTYGSSTNWGDLLTNYDGKAITYDTIGNPLKWHNTSSMDWEGRTLKKHGLLSNPNAEIEYSYNSDGIRVSKYHKDVSNGNSYRHSYRLDGTKIVLEQYYHIHDGITETYYYLYDESGSVIGFQYNNKTYYYQKNIQGDVLHIIDETGNIVTTYTYSAFGEVLAVAGSLASTIGAKNPFRYRSYYYDVETGWYYLNSRYYDPKVGRFINTDDASLITANPYELTDKNLFAYCDNNPVVRKDNGGEFWESAFDVISLGASIVEVCVNPVDPWAWAGLVGDAVDLIPFVTGAGELTRSVKTTVKVVEKSDDVVDAARVISKAADINKATGSYEIMYRSGKNYVGKGRLNRAIDSAVRNSINNNDEVLSIMWKSAPTTKDAFIDEYLMQKRFGGVLSSDEELWTYNKIWSPGRRYFGD